jgi:ABC-type transporter MlaC component
MLISALLACCIIGDAAAEPQAKTKGNNIFFQAASMVSEHCQRIAMQIEEPYAVVEYYKQTEIENENFPNFTFLLGQYASLIDRKNRHRFNALMMLKVAEAMDFKPKQYPFHGNCEVAANVEEDSISTVVAYGITQRKLTYKLTREEGYEWQIEDLIIGGISLADVYSAKFIYEISRVGFAPMIKNLCKTSNFSKLGCEE